MHSLQELKDNVQREMVIVSRQAVLYNGDYFYQMLQLSFRQNVSVSLALSLFFLYLESSGGNTVCALRK